MIGVHSSGDGVNHCSATTGWDVRVDPYVSRIRGIIGGVVPPPTGGGASLCAQVAEGDSASLSCSGRRRIAQFTFASYGNATGACQGGFRLGTCHSSRTAATLGRCAGSASCVVQANNATFGDLCPGVRKTLAVTYTCR